MRSSVAEDLGQMLKIINSYTYKVMFKDFQDFHMVQTPIPYPQLVEVERNVLSMEELLIMGNGHGRFK